MTTTVLNAGLLLIGEKIRDFDMQITAYRCDLCERIYSQYELSNNFFGDVCIKCLEKSPKLYQKAYTDFENKLGIFNSRKVRFLNMLEVMNVL